MSDDKPKPPPADGADWREAVVAAVAARIAAGDAPWRRLLAPGAVRAAPFNPATGGTYRGVNRLWLDMAGFADPRWITQRRARETDARVRAGERGRTIEYWRRRGRERPTLFRTAVFNAEQIDGPLPPVPPRPDADPAAAAAAILRDGAIRTVGPDPALGAAVYDRDRDAVRLPADGGEARDYYSSVFRALAHATGTAARLGRETGPYGSADRAAEQLRAEMAAYFVAGEIGLGHAPDRRESYAGRWLAALARDRDLLFRAARDADRIALWLREPAARAALERETAERQRAERRDAAIDRDPGNKPARRYLSVPYAERHAAKALGARWDRAARCWYGLDGADPALFARWPRGPGAPEPARADPREEFARACREHGLIVKGDPVMDGRWRRVAVEGDRGRKKSGSYRGFLDGVPNGQIMNYKTGGGAAAWVFRGAAADPAVLARAREEAAARKADNERRLRGERRRAAKRAYGLFVNAPPAPADHPYLREKGVPPGDLRIDRRGRLLMPLAAADGYIHNLQTIAADGTKRYLGGGRKTGLAHTIGDGDDTAPLLIAEGYATAQSLRLATGLPAAAALDAGNLKPAAEALRRKYPGRLLILAADDDHGLSVNVGLEAAERAAAAVGGEVLAPDLSASERAGGLTDFNDIHRARGLAALKRALRAALAPILARRPAPEKTRTRKRRRARAGP